MRFAAVPYKSLEVGDDGLVHQVVQKQRLDDNGGKSYDYYVLCGKYEDGMIHLYYNDAQVTCLVCLGKTIDVCCSRRACAQPIAEGYARIHKQTKAPYCVSCANKINLANNERIVVAQWELEL